MTPLEIALGAGCCLLAGMLLVLCWLVRSQAADLDTAQERIEDLIIGVTEANQSAAYWKQECFGARAIAAEPTEAETAVELAARGIDPAGVRPEDLPGLIAETENLTDEQRAELDERFGAITRGEIPYVQGIEEEN